MADVYDVANAIADVINATVQPLVGTTYPIYPIVDQIVAGTTGTVPPIQVMVGNILLEKLMSRLEQGKAAICVEADEKDLTSPQYLYLNDDDSANGPLPVSLLSTVIAGQVLTISGLIQVGDVIGLQQGALGAGYAVVGTDTLTTIATGLAAAANTAGIACTSSGATVTLTKTALFSANVGTTYSQRSREIWRRRKTFFASFYATTPYDRSYVGKYVEAAFPPGTRLVMLDGTNATFLFAMQSADFDDQQRDTTLIRRVFWTVDFLSIQVNPVVQVVASNISQTVAIGGVNFPSPPTASQL